MTLKASFQTAPAVIFSQLLAALVLMPFFQGHTGARPLTGQKIMEEVFRRHAAAPYMYEEQTMVLTDDAGNKDVRKVRYYYRVEKDHTVKHLMVFDHPLEIRGVALRVVKPGNKPPESGIYLPAHGDIFCPAGRDDRRNLFLGTDFAIEDMTETVSDFQYLRMPDEKIARTAYFVVEAVPAGLPSQTTSGYGKRKHYIQKDTFYIVRTDYFNPRGRFVKRLTRHDFKKLGKEMWRANMVFMDNVKQRHTTLIKTDRRIFSRDYVPARIFTFSWLKENRHVRGVPKKRSKSKSAEPETQPNHGAEKRIED